MRILWITPGAGDSYDCENCLRDNSLVWALREADHDVEMVLLYLPARADRDEERPDAPVFYGGINVFLQQKSSLFRRTPRWVDRMFDWAPLLRAASRRAGMTSAEDLGQTTLSMLKGDEGHQVKELERLVAHVRELPRPDIVVLSNLLLSGLAPRLRAELEVPVVCLAQDEDYFLDELGEPLASEAWAMVAERAATLDGCVAVSRYYGEVVGRRLALAEGRLHVVHSAIHTEDIERPGPPPDPPVLGFLSPLHAPAGADRVVEAWLRLRERPGLPNLELHIAGSQNLADRPFLVGLRERIAAAGLTDASRITVNPDRAQRLELLRGISALAVPMRRPEAFGRFVLESLASGVPVVLPDHGAFPELVAETGGGFVVPPHDDNALVDALADLLPDIEKRQSIGRRGRTAVLERFGLGRFADEMASVLERVAVAGVGAGSQKAGEYTEGHRGRTQRATEEGGAPAAPERGDAASDG